MPSSKVSFAAACTTNLYAAPYVRKCACRRAVDARMIISSAAAVGAAPALFGPITHLVTRWCTKMLACAYKSSSRLIALVYCPSMRSVTHYCATNSLSMQDAKITAVWPACRFCQGVKLCGVDKPQITPMPWPAPATYVCVAAQPSQVILYGCRYSFAALHTNAHVG